MHDLYVYTVRASKRTGKIAVKVIVCSTCPVYPTATYNGKSYNDEIVLSVKGESEVRILNSMFFVPYHMVHFKHFSKFIFPPDSLFFFIQSTELAAIKAVVITDEGRKVHYSAERHEPYRVKCF